MMDRKVTWKKDRFPVKGDVIISLRDKLPIIKNGGMYIVDRPYHTNRDRDDWTNYVIWIRGTRESRSHLLGEDWEYGNGKCHKCQYDCKRDEECEMFEEIEK